MPKEVKIITHYYYDPEFEGEDQCNGDYAEVSIQVDGEEVRRYGDAYHERGEERAQGFIDAMEILFPRVKIIKEKIADIKLY